ncbi:MAG: hypothetical protein WBP59_11130 [Ilumatobacteraceae bacterium]
MAFGQQSGPPATARQVNELLELLLEAGHTDFRDARGPLGFTQRQAGGKFTRDEADEFIAQLQRESAENAEFAETTGDPDTPAVRPAPSTATSNARPKRAATAREQQLRNLPTEELAAELQRRGWVVMEP